MAGDRSKAERVRKRLVWRMSEAVPLGEVVDPAQPAPLAPARPLVEPAPQGWAMSSFELLNGVEISEEDPSTVPAELIEELFNPKKAPG